MKLSKFYLIAATVTTLLLMCTLCFADKEPCGCTRESEDKICIAYYELKDQGFDVKVTCKKPKETK